MSKEKQIEEMAKAMCGNGMSNGNCATDDEPCHLECVYGCCAEKLHTAGYRKQEWISVEERLPEANGDVVHCIVLVKVGDEVEVDLAEWTTYFDCFGNKEREGWCIWNDWDEGQGCEITHWMPLPEPPKMKGGAE